MTKRKVREELKKPDFMLVMFERVTTWIKENLRLCIVGVAVLVVIGIALATYRIYEIRQDEKLQYQLQEGITAYQEYTTNGSSQALQKAESEFKGVVASRRKGLNEVAKLYLAKIYYSQGKSEDARSLYLDVKSQASSSVLRDLADAALRRIGPPTK